MRAIVVGFSLLLATASVDVQAKDSGPAFIGAVYAAGLQAVPFKIENGSMIFLGTVTPQQRTDLLALWAAYDPTDDIAMTATAPIRVDDLVRVLLKKGIILPTDLSKESQPRATILAK